MDLFIILLLVFVETSVYVDFPYNFISVSVTGYLTSKYELMALPYAILIGFFIGMSGYHVHKPIIFFIIFVIIMNQVFKHLLFDKINLILISLIEVFLYLSYVYFFEFSGVYFSSMIRETIFVLAMNYVLYRSERQK